MNETTNKNKIAWKSPSNIAIIKYWGKYGNQLPTNPSISFTLNNSFTKTELFYQEKEKSSTIDFDYTFEGGKNELFELKIGKFLNSIATELPILYNYKLNIYSKNSFPHSAGIASSASSMSALALALVDLEQKYNSKKYSTTEFLSRSSYFARLGSGSASRSIYPEVALWGKTSVLKESAQEFAIGLNHIIHPVYKNYQDTILIVDSGQKKVSSTAGHALMKTNPFSNARKEMANKNTIKLLEILKNGDLESFIKITENEALTLHAMMLSSDPWFSLLKPETLNIIEKVREFRIESKIPVCFTLDAGPNVHILYPEKEKANVLTFIKEELLEKNSQIKFINDKMGNGPIKIS